MDIRPQKGPQERFLATPADIAIYGGGAGAGKSWSLLVEPLRHIARPGFGAVIFRRTSPQITNEGSLWDESQQLYRLLGGFPRQSKLDWIFPNGNSITFSHLEREQNKFDWHGAQIPLICFDELTTFTEGQFWYLVSRNRSTCGIRPYVRATTNPDADHWLVNGPGGWGTGLISWWIDENGYAIPERSGVLRWFIRRDNQLIWADSRAELLAMYPDDPDCQPLSITFIAASLADNQILQAIDPGYRAKLLALPLVEQARLLGCNWKIRHAAGLFFKIDQFKIIEAPPEGLKWCRAWDLAASDDVRADWTVGLKIGKADNGRWCIADVTRGQWDTADRDAKILRTAELDGQRVRIHLPKDPGSAGKSQVTYLVRQLVGYTTVWNPMTGPKTARAGPLSSQVNAGNVDLVRGAWNAPFLHEYDRFPEKGFNDDQVDAGADGFNDLSAKRSAMIAI